MAHAFAFAGDPSLYHYAFRFLILVGPLVVQGLAVSGTSPLDGEGTTNRAAIFFQMHFFTSISNLSETARWRPVAAHESSYAFQR
jgi:hypothetical protein